MAEVRLSAEAFDELHKQLSEVVRNSDYQFPTNLKEGRPESFRLGGYLFVRGASLVAPMQVISTEQTIRQDGGMAFGGRAMCFPDDPEGYDEAAEELSKTRMEFRGYPLRMEIDGRRPSPPAVITPTRTLPMEGATIDVRSTDVCQAGEGPDNPRSHIQMTDESNDLTDRGGAMIDEAERDRKIRNREFTIAGACISIGGTLLALAYSYGDEIRALIRHLLP